MEGDGLSKRVRPRTTPPRFPELEGPRETLELEVEPREMALLYSEREGVREIFGLGVELRLMEVDGTEELPRLGG